MTHKKISTCPRCFRGLSEDEEFCPRCGTKNPEATKEAVKFTKELDKKLAEVILTTGVSVESKSVKEYKGLVSTEMILGLSIIRDIGADFVDFLGTWAKGYEKKIVKAKEDLLNKLKYEAVERETNAVISIDMDYQEMCGSMMLLSINGTAVRVE